MMLSEMLLSGAIYAFVGAFAGLMSGAIGIGGGIVVVPGLLFIFSRNQVVPDDVAMRVAAATSLAIMILTSLSAIRAHYKIGEILWPVFNKLWPGLLLGVICGVVAADSITTYWLKMIFGVFLLFVAYRMFTNMFVTDTGQFPKNWVNCLVSYLTGLLSGLLGVGGGVLIVPYLAYCGVAIRKIPPVSNLCTLLVGVSGTLTFIIAGQSEVAVMPYTTGYIYWPAVLLVGISSSVFASLGAKLNYIVPMKLLRYGFVVLLLLTAIKMLL
jgi:uncharacterized protein